jgi:hypothetical protein
MTEAMGMGVAMTVLMVGMMVLMIGGITWRVVSGRMRAGGRDRTPRADRHHPRA